MYFFYYAAYGIFTVYINVYYHTIGLSGVQIGWINALAPLVGIAAGPLWGIVSDRSGRPRLVLALAVTGAAVAVLGISAVKVFTGLLPLAATYFLFNSIINPTVDTTNLAVLGEQSERYGRQRIWGTIGYIVSTLAAGQFLQRVGLHWMFYGYFFLMILMLGAVPFLPVRPVHSSTSLKINIRELVGQRQWLFFIASLIPLWACSNGMYTFMGVYLKEMGGDAVLIGMNSSISAISEMPMMIFSAFLLSKLGLKRMLITAYALYAVRFLLYGLIPAPIWALPISLMHGVTFGLFWVSGVVYVNQLAPANLRTTSQTLFFAMMNLAGVVGSPFSGWVFDRLGPAQLFRGYAVLSLIALGILLIGFITAPKKEQSLVDASIRD